MLALTTPALKVTVPPDFTIGVAMLKVFTCALVEESEQIDVPVPLLAAHTPYIFPPPMFVALKVGTVPTSAKLLASFKTIVTVDEATPLASTGPVPTILEFVVEAAPTVKMTVPPALEMGVARVRVFVSA